MMTDKDLDAVIKKSKQWTKNALKINAFRYREDSDLLVVDLSTESALVIPKAKIPGLRNLLPHEMKTLEIEPLGFALWCESADTGVELETLLEIALGQTKTSAASH